MVNDTEEVKELIEMLQNYHSTLDKKGNREPASLRDLELIYGISHQTLSNWKKGAAKHKQLVDFIEKARKVRSKNKVKSRRAHGGL